MKGTVLHDGIVRATWWLDRDKGRDGPADRRAPRFPLGRAERDEVAAEGAALLRFVAADAAGHEIRFVT